MDGPGSVYKFTEIRERLATHQGRCLEFALGRHRDPPPAWLDAFVTEHAGLAMQACPSALKKTLAETAAATLSSVYDAVLPPASVLPAPSGRAAMAALAATLISPGDRVLLTEPGYPAFARVAAQQHADVVTVPLDPDRGFEPRLDTLEAGRETGIRLAALNYPNNPTGSLLTDSALEALAGRLERDAVIFNDAVYAPLTFDGPPYSLLAGRGAGTESRPRIELHSLGKLFSLGPLGIAFLVGAEDRIERIRRFGDFAWSQITTLQARVASGCLQDFSHVGGIRDGLRARMERLRRVVRELGFEPYPTRAGMYLLCRGPAEVSGRPVVTATEAADRLLDEYGLAVAPWDVPPHRYLRFSCAYLEEDIEGLESLASGAKIVAG